MARESLENHRLRTLIWIVNLLDTRPGLTLEEINNCWVADQDISYGLPIIGRTFTNYRHAIWDLFKISVECDRRNGYRYSLSDMGDSKVTKWLMRSVSLNEILVNNTALSSRIVLEDIPSGQEYLKPIMEAMKTSSKISFEYQQFHDCVSHWVKNAAPYCVKVYHQRWYVVVKEWRTELDNHNIIEELHVYSLDRIKQLKLCEERFVMDPLFDAERFFKYAFGVRVEKGNDPCLVRLKVAAVQRKYFRTLPLHHSQREVEITEDYSIFEMNVALTVELTMQILYYGSLVDVLEPAELRDEIADETLRMCDIYFEGDDPE